jgi:hypothetical protein
MLLCVYAIKFPLTVMITLTQFHSSPRLKAHHMWSRKSSNTPNRNRKEESDLHEYVNSMSVTQYTSATFNFL